MKLILTAAVDHLGQEGCGEQLPGVEHLVAHQDGAGTGQSDDSRQ